VRTREVRRRAPPPARRATSPSPCRGTRLSLLPLPLPLPRRRRHRRCRRRCLYCRHAAPHRVLTRARAISAAAPPSLPLPPPPPPPPLPRRAAHGATTAARANRRRAAGPLSRDALVTGCRLYAARRSDTLRRAQHALLTRTLARVAHRHDV